METKRKDVAEEDVLRWITLWEKLWESGEFRPWIEVQEVASEGRSKKIKGYKSGRKQHLLSDAEYYVFLLLEYDDAVVKIYEQFPLLPRDKTIQIANERGIPHPKYRRVSIREDGVEKKPLPNKVMSTDFLIEIKRNGNSELIAICVKTKSKITPTNKKNKGTLLKLEIERQYWLDQGIKCYCIAKEDINKDLIFNLKWFHEYASLDEQLLNSKKRWKEVFLNELKEYDKNNRLVDIIELTSLKTKIQYDDSVRIFRHLMWHKELKANISKKVKLTTKIIGIGFKY